MSESAGSGRQIERDNLAELIAANEEIHGALTSGEIEAAEREMYGTAQSGRADAE
ncbi:hypothetical protein [Streptomyces sp. NPDC090053]|uniref:hypothetical protein n=1 Tax=Streptomyces sp. NPDC090053 TaxID=3365932 RepID=UPI00382170FE